LLRLSQPYPGSAAIFVDEFDTGSFKRAPNHLESCTTGLTFAGLQLIDGNDAHAGFVRKILLAPIKQSTSGPTLSGSNHLNEDEPIE
jgi:hypothetical protein